MEIWEWNNFKSGLMVFIFSSSLGNKWWCYFIIVSFVHILSHSNHYIAFSYHSIMIPWLNLNLGSNVSGLQSFFFFGTQIYVLTLIQFLFLHSFHFSCFWTIIFKHHIKKILLVLLYFWKLLLSQFFSYMKMQWSRWFRT